MLGKNSNLPEVLWNFSRYKDDKRLTLKQNPHFYKVLPERPGDYGGDFRSDPIEQFLDALGNSLGRDGPKPKISVLTDRHGRIYLESGQGPRAFGNVWCPGKAIIFKGSPLPFSSSPLFTSLQAFAESSKVKGSSGRPLKANLTYCIARSVGRLLHQQIPWIGSHYRTGESQSAAC